MWPRDFEKWWPFAAELVEERTYDRLMMYRLLSRDGQTRRHADEIARQVVPVVYDLADRRRGVEGCFPGRGVFLHWAVECGWWQALRLLLTHACVRPWLEARDQHGPIFSDEVRAVLFWLFVDQFTERQIAAVRRLARDKARQEAIDAYRALCGLLLANGFGREPFPRPPALVGWCEWQEEGDRP